MAVKTLLRKPDPPDRQRRDLCRALGSGVVVAALGGLARPALGQATVRELGRIELKLRSPRGLACAPDGTFWLSESGRYRIVQLDQKGALLRSFGRPGSGPGRLNWPGALRLDERGRLWIADTNNGRIAVHSLDGSFLGQYGRLGGTPGRLFSPEGLALGQGKLYVANTRGHNVQAFDLADAAVSGVFGVLGEDPPNGPLGFDYGLRLPSAVCALENKLLVLDSKHGRVLELGLDGRFLYAYGASGSAAGDLSLPQDMLAAPDGTVLVADTGNNRLVAYQGGEPLPAIDLELGRPLALDRSPDGRLVVLDAAGPSLRLLEGI